MKKGCFVSIILSLTVLIAVSIYIVKKHRNTAFSAVKPIVLSSMENGFREDIENIKDKEYSDTLNSLVTRYFEHAKTNKEFGLDDIKVFGEEVKWVTKDGIIDSADISKLTDFLNKELSVKNERPEENSH